MIVNDRLAIPDEELVESFVRASGPGGQNVNKVSSAVELRFDAMASEVLPGWVKGRLRALAGRRMTKEGVIVIRAEEYRDQPRNREAARARLAGLIREAATRDKPRRPTRPTLASKKRRLEGKKKRSTIKRLRDAPRPD